MPNVAESPPALETLADLLQRLGNIPLERIRMTPPPGCATVNDVIEIHDRENRLFELVDGVLVEKAIGFGESVLTASLICSLLNHVHPLNAGIVLGPDGMVHLRPGLVRAASIAFFAWERIPGRPVPTEPIPSLAPDLAIDVLRPTNTDAEMDRKLREYFEAGVHLVWLVDPRSRTVTVYTAPDQFKVLSEAETLNGEPVLPGFVLPLKDLFAELDRQGGA